MDYNMKNKLLIVLMVIGSINVWAEEPVKTKSPFAPICSSDFKSFLDLAAEMAGEFTFGLSHLFPFTINAACPEGEVSTDPKVLARLNELTKGMDSIKQQLDLIGINQEALWIQVNDIIRTSNVKPYKDRVKAFDFYIEQKYKTSFFPYSSLQEVSQSYQDNNIIGFKKLFTNDLNYGNIFRERAQQIEDLQQLISIDDARTLANNLRMMCYDASNEANIHGEIFSTRRNCNAIAVDIVAGIDLRAAQTNLMLSDQINTVNHALKTNNIDSSWLLDRINGGYNINYFYKYADGNIIPWENALLEAKNITTKYKKDIKDILIGKNNEKLFPLAKDFPPYLLNMVREACNSPGATVIGEPNSIISEWYTQPKPYIVTNCPKGSDKTVIIKSKLYYKGVNKVSNVLGVLVPINGSSDTLRDPNSVNQISPPNYSITSINTDPVEIPVQISQYVETAGNASVKMSRNTTYGYTTNSEFTLFSNVKLTINTSLDEKSFLSQTISEDPQQPKRFLLSLKTSSNLSSNSISSKWEYVSSIDNISNKGSKPVIKKTIYASAVANNLHYAFGIYIQNTGINSKPPADEAKTYKGRGKYTGGEEKVSLICFAKDIECTVSGTKLIWNDGSNIELKKIGNDIDLNFVEANNQTTNN
jgi:hypothetical protein